MIILDVIMYCDHLRWYEIYLEVRPPFGGGISYQRWDLRSEVWLPNRGCTPICSRTSNWMWDLISEVVPPIRGGPTIGSETSDWRWTSNQRQDFSLELGPLIRGVPTIRDVPESTGETSNQRWDLHLEVRLCSKETYQLQLEVLSLLSCK